MKKNKLELGLIMKVDLNHFVDAVRGAFTTDDELDDNKKMASFALSLGENGDISYELILLKKISELIITVYGDVTEDEDMDMFKLVQKIKELIPLMDEIEGI